MWKFGPTNSHASAFAPKQWLYEREAMGMESSKIFCPSRCRYRTSQCVSTNYLVSWGLYWAQNGNMRNFGSTNPHGTAFAPKQWLYQKEATGVESSKLYVLVGTDTLVPSAVPQTTPCHGGLYRVQKGNMRNFGRTNPRGTTFAPKQWLYEKEATGIENLKMYFPSRCSYRT